MLLNIIVFLIFVLQTAHLCCGIRDIPFYDETPLCSDDIYERREMPLYEFEKPPIPLDRMLDVVFSPDMPKPFSFLKPFSGANDLDEQYMTTPQLRLKKRSITESEESMKDDGAQYEVKFLSPLTRETRDKEDIKTIHLPPSFIPRLGRKRSQEVDGDMNENGSNNEAEQLEDSEMTLGKSEKRNKINLYAGSAFTPRLGKSDNSPRIRFQAGNAFTPRLGRSEDSPRIRFQAGSAFTPRLGRSEDSPRIRFQAGSAFTPRLGRSEDSQRIRFQAGSAFTPRLGRSEDSQSIRFQAGSAFTPRLGRSSNLDRVIFNPKAAFNLKQQRSNRINLNAGSAFTPRLGRSDESKMTFNAGSSFTPRLGRSEDQSRIQLNAGSAFTPRLG